MPHAVALVGCAIIAAGAAVLVNELVVQPHLEEQRRQRRRRQQRASAHNEEERELRELERAIEISLREHEQGELRHRHRHRHSERIHGNSEYSDPFCLHVAAVRVGNANARTTVEEMLTIAQEYGSVALCRCCANRNPAAQSTDFEIIYESQWAARSAISALHGLILNGRALIVHQIPIPGQDDTDPSSSGFMDAETAHEDDKDDFPGYRPFPRAQSASLGYTPRASTNDTVAQPRTRRWSPKPTTTTGTVAQAQTQAQTAVPSISDRVASPLYDSQTQQPEMSERHSSSSSSGAGIFSVKPASPDVLSSPKTGVDGSTAVPTIDRIDRKDSESPLDSSIEDLGADGRYGVIIEPSRAASSSSSFSTPSTPARTSSCPSPSGDIVALQGVASAALGPASAATFLDAQQQEEEEEAALAQVERPASRASSLSSGVTLISRPVTPILLEALDALSDAGVGPGSGSGSGSSSASQSGWEDLGNESSDEEREGSLISRPPVAA